MTDRAPGRDPLSQARKSFNPLKWGKGSGPSGPSASQPKPDIHGRLGLNLLFSPVEPLLELIFVHGLAGGSTKTWCYDKDITKFWPKEWLPQECGFGNIRIFSYGYDASLKGPGPGRNVTIYNFGQQLYEELRNSPHISSSKTNPIVFVGHNMGGLVIKQACVLAHENPSTLDLAKRMKAIMFLGTPHRGTDLAKTLNRFLKAMPGRSPRAFVSNLDRRDLLLQSLNDSFRHVADEMALFSFYESRPTNLIIRKDVLVPKDSSILGYPKERFCMLDADHAHLSKYESQLDSNYTFVVEVLQTMTRKILEEVEEHQERASLRTLTDRTAS